MSIQFVSCQGVTMEVIDHPRVSKALCFHRLTIIIYSRQSHETYYMMPNDLIGYVY